MTYTKADGSTFTKSLTFAVEAFASYLRLAQCEGYRIS